MTSGILNLLIKYIIELTFNSEYYIFININDWIEHK